MEILEFNRYTKYNRLMKTSSKSQRFLYDKFIPLLLFAIVGAFGWAIRGTGGYGGTSGAIVVGLWWGFLFYYLAKLQGVDARWQGVALGLGIGFGGMNGYGQLLSWSRGTFGLDAPNQYLDINPVVGFLWLTLIGLEWGGTGAALLSWTLTKDNSIRTWLYRIILPAIFAIVFYLVVRFIPSVFFPHYNDGIYFTEICMSSCERTAETLPSLAALFGIFIGLFIAELLLKNKEGIKSMIIMALGFGIVFPLAAYWFYLGEEFPFDWWKVWEESIGLIGGLSIGIVFLYLMNEKSKNQINTEDPGEISKIITKKQDWRANLVLNLFLIVLLTYTTTGMSETLGIHIGAYSAEDLGSIDYPPFRIFVILAILLPVLILTIRNMIKTKKDLFKSNNQTSLFQVDNITSKFLYLNDYIALAGIIAIFDGIHTLFYVGFFFIILTAVLKLNDFLSKEQLNQ